MSTQLGTMSQHFDVSVPDEDNMDIDIDIDMDGGLEPIPEPELEVLLSGSFYQTAASFYIFLTGRGRIRVDTIQCTSTQYYGPSHLYRRS